MNRTSSTWILTAIVAGLACTAWGCAARPVAHLERSMGSLERQFQITRSMADPVEQVRAYIRLRADARVFRDDLEGERTLAPSARVRGSSEAEGGIGWVHLDRRDVASVRGRVDRLLRSVDRFLTAAAPARLEGSGYALEGDRLVEVQ
jgi:hypothetical protein